MKYFSILSFSLALLLASQVFAQPCKQLELSQYDAWKSIQGQLLSNDGKWFVYEQNPLVGDGDLMVKNLQSSNQMIIPRATKAIIDPASTFIAFAIQPPYAVMRTEKLAGKKGEKLPQDSLGILFLESRETIKFPLLNKFAVSEKEGSLVAWLHQAEYKIRDTISKDSASKAKPVVKKKTDVKPAVLGLYNAVSRLTVNEENVTDFVLSRTGSVAFFVQQKKDSIDSCFIVRYDGTTNSKLILFANAGQIKSITTDEPGNQLAFLYSADTAKRKLYQLGYWQKEMGLTIAIDTASPQLPENYTISEFSSLQFSDDKSVLYLGIAPKPAQQPKDTLTEDEKVSVDIWNWKDDLLQTQQIKQLENEKKRNYLAIYYPLKQQLVQLANETVPDIRPDLKNNPEWMLVRTSKPYDYLSSWEQTRYQDVYRVNRKTGEMQLLLEKSDSFESLRDDGNYLLYYSLNDSAWHSLDCVTNNTIKLTSNLSSAFYNVDSDIPDEAGPYGFVGWTKDGFAMVYSQYDLWLLDPGGKMSAAPLTHQPKTARYRYRYLKLDDEEKYLPEKMYLSVFDQLNKQSGFSLLDRETKQHEHLIIDDFHFSSLTKAKDAPVLMFEKESFTTFPDWYLAHGKFDNAIKVTEANPQQDEYCWGTVKLVHWKTNAGEKLDGLMYLPVAYDRQKSVPLLVYFYERYSDQLHRYYQPKPSRSVINFSEYTSRGYAVFVPDIAYKTGSPGQSAYDAIMSGVDAMLKQFQHIDSSRLGLQGQSWGGYQTAWLITKTNRFKAAMAGAPVSNMTSAYGGIRWESGMSRAFQYEDGQSRIGADLWTNLDAYIENSPLFYADKVQTPLLIMHNDHDGAVPWYQGIEYFSALRRLRKPVWMLVYNNAPHNLRRLADTKDLTLRLQQFFDHFLMGAPEPVWMKEGIPAIKKGIDTGFGLNQ